MLITNLSWCPWGCIKHSLVHVWVLSTEPAKCYQLLCLSVSEIPTQFSHLDDWLQRVCILKLGRTLFVLCWFVCRIEIFWGDIRLSVQIQGQGGGPLELLVSSQELPLCIGSFSCLSSLNLPCMLQASFPKGQASQQQQLQKNFLWNDFGQYL